MKKNRVALSFTVIVMLISLSWVSGFCGDTQPNQPAPLFLNGEVPPLVMLVMERDHRLYFNAYDDMSDLDADGEMETRYKPSIDYYGYFDCDKCYDYSSTNSRFEPAGTATDKKCTGKWSGNFLNYVTMSRMDCLRKVLYGGYRSTDTATETVLQRAYIPQDAHAWAKKYQSIANDGYDIRDYTPLSLPSQGTRHLFANTTLSDNGTPLMRVLDNSNYQVWEWVSIERINGGTKCLDGSSGPDCAHAGGTQWQIVPQSAFQNLTQTTYNTTGYTSFPANHSDFNTLVTTYGVNAKKFGSAPVANINGQGNPFNSQQDYYMTIFQGQIVVPTTDTYTFAVDGDDAVEVIIDGTAVASWYGPHGKCSCQTHTGSISLTAGAHDITFRHQEKDGQDNYYLYWQKTVPASTMTDYAVRVKVGVDSMPESNCKKYTSGVYKPTGILQRYGESDRMYFGLLTGSYTKNLSGGVLRKNIGSIKNEIDSNTGQFTSVNGIISTINKLRIVGYNYGDHSYNQNCGWISSRPLQEGECRMWGNPIGEMMYEALRYFAGKKTPTSAFNYSGTTDDSTLDLPQPAWEDPYKDNSATGYTGSNYCAKPFMLVLSDISPNYDTDQMPGSAFNSFSGDLSGFNAASLADTIGTEEAVAGSYFIGQQGSNYNGACTPKTVVNLGDIRGLCPDAPTKQGGYYSAAAAYYGHITDLNPVQGDQKVTTYAVALSTPLPKIEIPVGGKTVTLVPFAKSAGGCLGINGAQGAFQPTDQILQVFVDAITPYYGRFRINFEDQEQGADYDMDAIAYYQYQVTGNTVTITVDSSQYAAGCIIQHMGFIISGTTEDGTYLVVRDMDTAEGSDVNYYLDTPQHPGTALPLIYTRNFTPGATSGAGILQNPLWYAAKWGGFDDINKNSIPDDPREWDTDNDGVPDNYFYVQNPLRLEEQLNKSFSAILKKAASGSAVSVLATKGEGEGTLIQAYFKPKVTDETGLHDITWAGYLQCLWVDAYGNIREDTVHDYKLNVTEDNIIEYYQDPDTGDTKVKRYPVDTMHPYDKNTTPEYISLDKIQSVWEAGKKLWVAAPADRRIYTYTDNFIEFTTVNAEALKPYLDVASDTAFIKLGATQNNRVANVVNFIRGADDNSTLYAGSPTLRKRDITIDGETHSWVLGDIVYSTPVSISKPVEQYGLLYDDKTYKLFYDKYKDRETVVYVGANDGMIHAFSAGQYNVEEKKFEPGPTVGVGIGEELWAYVPHCLLPHLKWLALPSYSHLSYVDLKPKVVDAKIFTPDATHPNGWGTLLICGMNMGGQAVTVTDTAFSGGAKSFSSSYVVLDITDPSQLPTLLWEKSFSGLGYSTTTPCIVKVNDAWFFVVTSGPTDYDGTSTNPGRVYIADLASGTLLRTFPSGLETSENNAVMNSPVALDKNMNYSVAAIYVGESYTAGSPATWKAKAYKIAIPQLANSVYDPSAYDDNPANWKWVPLADFSDLPQPGYLSAPFTVSVDNKDNAWIFIGTGRYVTTADKTDANQNYLFGIKDPFYNWRGKAEGDEQLPSCLHNYNPSGCTLSIANLFDASPYAVKADGTIDTANTADALRGKTFESFIKEGVQKKDNQGVEVYQGWYRKLAVTTGSPSERVVNKPAAIGGLALFPTFTPDSNLCLSGGNSRLYALYYITGTAYKKPVFKNLDNSAEIKFTQDMGAGLASSSAIHLGKKEGQTGTVISQLSTGQIVQIDVTPALAVKSGTQYWKEGK
ncbi:MAG: PilC/PilY family type IV pilus protein [Proteobacteria bacterium]|nr:PilC/PilY family type IV pilus protein [Pseudomonadota bacterium]